MKTTTEAAVLKAFGIGLDSQDSSAAAPAAESAAKPAEAAAQTEAKAETESAAKPAEAEAQTEAKGEAKESAKLTNKGTVLTAVRTNGDVFPMRVTVVKVNNNVLTAKLEDTNQPTIEVDGGAAKDRTMSSSSFSSYQDTFGSQRSGSIYTNSLYRSSLGSFAGVVVDMNEIDDESQWVGTGRYTAGREEVYREVRALPGVHRVGIPASASRDECRVADRVLGPASLAGERRGAAEHGGPDRVVAGRDQSDAERGGDEDDHHAAGARADPPSVRQSAGHQRGHGELGCQGGMQGLRGQAELLDEASDRTGAREDPADSGREVPGPDPLLPVRSGLDGVHVHAGAPRDGPRLLSDALAELVQQRGAQDRFAASLLEADGQLPDALHDAPASRSPGRESV